MKDGSAEENGRDGQTARAALEADLLYVPRHPPPSMARLQASPWLRKVNMVRTIWKGSRNLLDLIHPELAQRRWYAARAGADTVITVKTRISPAMCCRPTPTTT